MTKDTNNKIQLELHVPDMDLASDFYSKLGFEVVWQRQKGDGGDYMVMNRNGTIINFWPGNMHVWEQPYFKKFPKDTKRGYGVEIVFNVENIKEYYDEVKKFAKIVEPLKMEPWRLYDFRLEDPFGFYIRIGEPHNILDSSNAVD